MRLKTIGLISSLALGLLVLPLPANAQKPGRPYRIGALNQAFAPNPPSVEGLKAGLKAMGLEEGRDVTFDIRFTKGNPHETQAAAAALVEAGVDLIFTSGEVSARAAKSATQTIPIVFVMGNPVAAGIVREVAHPRGNITGVYSRHTELVPKQLEILKTLIPTLSRVWLIYPTDDLSSLAFARKAQEAAPLLKLELVARPVRTAAEVGPILEALRPGDGLLPPPTKELDIRGKTWYRAAQVPSIFQSAFWVRRGALVSYGADYYPQGVQAARLVAKILRGARPQDLPVEGADKIELVINLKTAKKLGLKIPPSILYRADEVIK